MPTRQATTPTSATVGARVGFPAADDDGDVDTQPADRPRRREGLRLSARAQILGWSVLLLAASMLASTLAVHLLLQHHADLRISSALAHERDEFISPGPTGSTGSTGVTTPVAARLKAATSRAVPEREIILLGLLNGRLSSVSAGRTAASVGLEATDVARLSAITAPARGTLELTGGQVRYLALPVRTSGDPNRGTFVAAVFTAPERAAVWRVTRLQLEVGTGSLLLASVLAWLMAGRVLRPIRATTELARRITDTDLSDRLPVAGGDEVSQMAATFNGMLDRLQSTFDAQRHFLADAGHELRTPITIIQGNLDTLSNVDADDEATLTVVADELARMARLVDELALLAATDRPDFLRPAATDLSALSHSMAAKAAAIGSRGWRLTAPLTGWALLDPQRITQAVMQLAVNADAHTPADVAVDLDFRTAAGELAFAVVDHGPGVPAADRDRIFDRFVRLDARHDRSTGLGLSIVAAIAAAHNGTVTVTDTPGGGATFTLRIPIHAVTDPHRAVRDERVARLT